METEKAQRAELVGEPFEYIIDDSYAWSTWAPPKDEDGNLDFDLAATGPDLIEFVIKNTFQGAGVKTVVLLFEKGAPTRKVWFYQLDPGRNMGKKNPLNDKDLEDLVEKQASFADSDKSWSMKAGDIYEKTWDLSVKNPTVEEEAALRAPDEIIREIRALDIESERILRKIGSLI